jgi:hypothetical protein
MLLTATALAGIVLAHSARGKEPPTQTELAAISDRGRDLAAYDAAAWHASDAVRTKEPKEGSVVRYIACKTDKGWTVAFGRIDEKQRNFLIAYEATQVDKSDVFDVTEHTPTMADTGFYLSAARAIDTSLQDFAKHFEGEQRPYNVAVLPAEQGRLWVYLVPAPTKPNVWPLGGDVRYLISRQGTKVIEKRQLHKVVIENEPPKPEGKQQVAGFHTHVLSDRPEDTDVFHVLTRRPTMPELIRTEHFVFAIEVDGKITFQGSAASFSKQK